MANRNDNPDPLVTVCVKLRRSQAEGLANLKRRTRISKAELSREAVADLLAKHSRDTAPDA